MQDPAIKQVIHDLGDAMGPEVVERMKQVFQPEQQVLAARYPATASDLAYGDHSRQRLDVYGGDKTATDRPILLFVHGGGFVRGDKGSEQQWPNAAVGRMAAANGMLGVVINYRLAPEFTYPSGAEDIHLAIDWVKKHAEQYGGSSKRLILMGTSAGAVHVASYIKQHPAGDDITAAILLSGLYGYTPLDERDTLYYGDQSHYAERQPRKAVEHFSKPLLVACSEFDPFRFQTETAELLCARLKIHRHLPRTAVISGHNHYSLAMHLGTSDKRLEQEIMDFIAQATTR